jgi:pilus assembly protein CpaE
MDSPQFVSEGSREEPRILAVGTPPTFRQQVARVLEIDADDVEWVPSVTAAEELLASKQHWAHVLVVSPGVKELDAFGLAQFLGRTSPATAVILVRERAANGLLPAAMRSGIRDVVDLSKGSQDLREALERAILWSLNLRSVGSEYRSDARPTARGALVSVFSSKGGTGKTFVTCNLAVALAARTKERVAVVDADHDLGDVMTYFGKESNRAVHDLMAVGDMTDRDAIVAAGIEVMPNLIAYAAPMDPGADPVAGEAMGKFLRAVRSVFGYTVVDASADYSDQALATFDLSDRIFLVSGLDIVSVRHLSSSLRTLLSLGVDRERFQFILNRADSKVGLDPHEVERVMKLQADAMIPSSRLVPLSLNKGRPVYAEEPRSAVAKAFDGLVDKVLPLTQSPGSPSAPTTGRRGRAAKK